PKFEVEGRAIRVPLTRVKGLGERTKEGLLCQRKIAPFLSLPDFCRRVGASGEEMEAMTRCGAFDEFGESRTRQFWQAQVLARSCQDIRGSEQGWLLLPPGLERLPQVPLREPTLDERLEWETELLDFPVSAHPLTRYDDVAWDTYCPVARLGEHV